MSAATDYGARITSLMSEPSRDHPRDPARLARVARTRTEMMAQGGAVTATLQREAGAVASLARLVAGRRPTRVVIAGCGDSWFIGMAVRHAWESLLGIPAEAAQALDYAAYGAAVADARTLVIGLSAGGNTPAVMAALQAAHSRGAMAVGVSNTPGSPVLTRFGAGLQVHATRSGWPTQSSTAAIALLCALAAAIAQEARPGSADGFTTALGRMPALMDATATALDGAAAAVAAEVRDAGLVLFAGLGPNFAAASFGAAKVRELSPAHALAMPLEEMHHYRLPKHGDPVFIIATDPPSRERALDTVLVAHAIGAHGVAVLAGSDPDIAAHARHVLMLPPVIPALAPMLASVPLQLFAYHFAMARAG